MRLEANARALTAAIGRVDLDPGPTLAIVMNELGHDFSINDDDQVDRSAVSLPRDVVVDPGSHHESIAERHVLEDGAYRLWACRVLPDTAPRVKLEIRENRRPHPEPGPLRVAYEPLRWAHRTAFEATRVGTRSSPGTALRRAVVEDLDPRISQFLDEVVEHERTS